MELKGKDEKKEKIYTHFEKGYYLYMKGIYGLLYTGDALGSIIT